MPKQKAPLTLEEIKEQIHKNLTTQGQLEVKKFIEILLNEKQTVAQHELELIKNGKP